MRLSVIILIALFPAFAFADEAPVTRLHDQTYNTDQTWSGVITIDGVVQFAVGTTLTIQPGTVVKFTKTDTDGDGIGENEVYVQGRIVAKGTADRPIVFTSAEARPKPGDWGALNIMVSEGQSNEIEGCVIEYAYRGFHMHFSKATLINCTIRHNYLGIQCQDSELVVSGCDIRDNKGAVVFKDSKLKITDNRITDNYWGIRFLYGEAELTGNVITGNMVNGVTFRENKVAASGNVVNGNRKGFSAEDADVELKGNSINENAESGVYLKHTKGLVIGNQITANGNSGISVEDSPARITGNNIVANAAYGVDNNGSMDVDAAGNWWGVPDAASVQKMVYDRADDQKLGKVIVAPVAVGPQ